MKKSICTIVLVLLISVVTFYSQGVSQTSNVLLLDSTAVSPPATIDDFSFIAGNWTGPAFGGTCYEDWSEPSGGTMVGTFKAVNDSGIMFYEFMLIVPQGESCALILKHFNDDLTGWETKDEVISFPLVKLEEKAAYFDGLTMRRTHQDSLEVYVLAGSGDKLHELAFNYSRYRSE